MESSIPEEENREAYYEKHAPDKPISMCVDAVLKGQMGGVGNRGVPERESGHLEFTVRFSFPTGCDLNDGGLAGRHQWQVPKGKNREQDKHEV